MEAASGQAVPFAGPRAAALHPRGQYVAVAGREQVVVLRGSSGGAGREQCQPVGSLIRLPAARRPPRRRSGRFRTARSGPTSGRIDGERVNIFCISSLLVRFGRCLRIR